MTSTGGGEGRWPFERVADGPGSPAAPGQGAPTPPTSSGTPGDPPGPGRRSARKDDGKKRPPLWLLIVLGLVVVGAAVALVVLLTTDRTQPEPAPASTITLPPPTPTIDPIERAEGTAFQQALPATVLQFALTEEGEHEPLLAAGALESYRLVYSDGGDATLTVLAAQWPDDAGPAAQLEAVLAELGDVPEATDEPADETPEATEPADGEDGEEGEGTPTPEPPPGPVQGPVLVDGTEVGRYVFVAREDGTGTVWWTNTTVFIQLDGPWQVLRDVFAAFPL